MGKNNILYPVVVWLIRKCKSVGLELFNEQNERTLRNEGLVGQRKSIWEYTVEKMSLSIIILLVSFLLAIAYFLGNSGIERKEYVERPQYGMDVQPFEVLINGSAEKFQILSRQYDLESVKENFRQAYEELLVMVRGNNKSLEEVRTDLKLPTYLDQYAIAVNWSSNRNEYVNGEGTVFNYYFEENQREWVTLSATLSYEEYSCLYDIDICVQAPILSPKEALGRQVARNIEEMNQNNRLEDKIVFPESMNGQRVEYRIKRDKLEWVFVFGGIVAAVAVFLGKDADLRNLDKKRGNQMMLDYPEIISKLTILLGSGMSVRLALEKIISDYQKKGIKRYAYEELVITCNEIRAGELESIAYSKFGKRCNIHEYLKLGALLEQNVKSGTKGLAAMLENEAWLAFEVRKNTAVKMGEEAGTKLLLPMIMMLAVVLIIVMVPALMSLGM